MFFLLFQDMHFCVICWFWCVFFAAIRQPKKIFGCYVKWKPGKCMMGWSRTRHDSCYTVFDSRSSHVEDLKTGACGPAVRPASCSA